VLHKKFDPQGITELYRLATCASFAAWPSPAALWPFALGWRHRNPPGGDTFLDRRRTLPSTCCTEFYLLI
jgi:hypothetical protein